MHSYLTLGWSCFLMHEFSNGFQCKKPLADKQWSAALAKAQSKKVDLGTTLWIKQKDKECPINCGKKRGQWLL